MTNPVRVRVQKHRKFLRKSGLRPIQIWVPDTRSPDFLSECHRQSKLAAEADMSDSELLEFMDKTLTDIDGWVA